MKRGLQWFGFILSLGCTALSGYCWYRASIANMHVRLAEQEDLRLFPELGREIDGCLTVMLVAVVVLAGFVVFLLRRAKSQTTQK
jgi:hypothetical protein